MIFTALPLEGAYLIEPEPLADERGCFARLYDQTRFAERGLECRFVQTSLSFNAIAGTVRGMHFQRSPHEEAKLVRCTRGAVYDVIVDLRRGSPTRYQWHGVTLSEENRAQLYIPKGFAHGFQALRDGAEVFYMISADYAPGSAAGIRWDDPGIRVEWPLPVACISRKDRLWPLLQGMPDE